MWDNFGIPGANPWALGAAALVAAFGTALVLALVLRKRRVLHGKARRVADTVEMQCSICQKTLVFHRAELAKLSPAEMALAVRGLPKILRRPLAEYVCPYCEAAHCFATDSKAPEWIGVNLYEPQVKTARCRECGVVLGAPAAGGRVVGKAGAESEVERGLECPWCHAVCCMACCTAATRNRTKDASLLCPRCFRGPMRRVSEG